MKKMNKGGREGREIELVVIGGVQWKRRKIGLYDEANEC
jgi:hypothetical protein